MNPFRYMTHWAVPAVALAIGVAMFAFISGSDTNNNDRVAHPDRVVVHMSPYCSCCGDWVEYIENEGFDVDVRPTADLQSVRDDLAVPMSLTSCHTAEVGGYVVEGHVPAEEVHTLLEERPDYRGIAVPGMPVGSPGMEGPNPEAFEVIAFAETGETEVVAEHP